MGCDIHMVLERKMSEYHWLGVRTFDGFHTGDNLEWESPPATYRNYLRFAALAGVRGDGPEARGMPPDASELSRYLFQIEGDHTPSWLPLREAAAIFLITGRGPVSDWIRESPACFYFGVSDDDIDQFRLVFWFDS
jgi:hypothetical protein